MFVFFSCICVLHIVCACILSEGVVASIYPDTSISLFVFFLVFVGYVYCVHMHSISEGVVKVLAA